MERSLDPQQLLHLVRKWLPVILAMAVLGAGIAYVVGRSSAPRYYAQGLLRAVPAVGANSQSTGVPPDATQTDAVLITQDAVLNAVITDLHISATPDGLRQQVSATPGPSTDLITVGVTAGDPRSAASLANAVMTVYTNQVTTQTSAQIDAASAALRDEIQTVENSLQQENAQLARLQQSHQDTTAIQNQINADTATLTQLTQNYSSFRAQQTLAFNRVQVAAAAAVPGGPVNQHKLLDAGIGATAGLLIGVALAVVLQVLDQGLRNEEDVRRKLGIPVLAMVPRYGTHKGGQHHREVTAAGEAYRRLRTSLLFAAVDTPVKSIVVTSARIGEGKTRTAANLAGVLAAAGTRVLLVDADMRRPSQHRIFDRSLQGGMSELLLIASQRDQIPSLNGALQTEFANLSLLTSGTVPPNPSELLASRAAEATLRSLERDFDMLVIDTPPADVVTDALSLAAKASVVIIVIDVRRAKVRHVRETIEQLRGVGGHVAGAVLNKTRRSASSYEYHYYYDEQTSAAPSPLVAGLGDPQPQAAAAVWEPVADPR